jgi:hypothetical protein
VNDAPDPFGVTDDGETVQLASGGAPEQVNATAELNPFAGETCKL